MTRDRKNISGQEQEVGDVLKEYAFNIPEYQRPYAWTTIEAGELFEDLRGFHRRSNTDEPYFLGSIVLIKEDRLPKADVIDGQQRLTTLSLLYAAIRSQAEGKLWSDLEKVLQEPGDTLKKLKERPRLQLRQQDQRFYEEYILGMKFEELVRLDPAQLPSEAQRNLRDNALLLHRLVKQNFPTQAELQEFAYDISSNCMLVVVSTASTQTAFRVFSVLNSRGLDLLPTDILKADIIGSLPEGPARSEATKMWEELEDSAGRDGFLELFGHLRMIFMKRKATRSLLDDFKDLLKDKLAGKDFVQDVLEPYAEAFLIARGANYTATTNATDINSYLRVLRRTENSDWMPVAMQFLKTRHDAPAYVDWFMRKLERLAASLHIRAQDVNKRIARYAEVLQEMEVDAHSLANPLKAIELRDEEISNTLEVLDGPVYRMAARRRNFILQRLDSFVGDNMATYDNTFMSVEHVLPQTVDAGSEWETWWPDKEQREQWVHRLANLVPLNRKTNSAAQNYEFLRKRDTYFRNNNGVSTHALTTMVLNSDDWKPETVRARQNELIAKAAIGWDLVV